MKKLLLFSVLGLLVLGGCGKGEEDINPASSSIQFNGESIPVQMVFSDGEVWRDNEMNSYREFTFYSNSEYTLSVSAYYNDPNDWQAGLFSYLPHNSTENYPHFLASLSYDANKDGYYSGADDFSLTTEGGTFEIVKLDAEAGTIEVKMDISLQDNNSLKGTFSGSYAVGDQSPY